MCAAERERYECFFCQGDSLKMRDWEEKWGGWGSLPQLWGIADSFLANERDVEASGSREDYILVQTRTEDERRQ